MRFIRKVLLKLCLFFLVFPCNIGNYQGVDVLDNVLDKEDINSIRTLLSDNLNALWSFHDLHSKEQKHSDCSASSPNHYWLTKIQPSVFSKHLGSVSDKLRQQVAARFAIFDPSLLKFHHVEGQISFRGDNPLVSKPCSVQSKGRSDVVIVVFLVQNWTKNSYGEIVVYGSDGEVLKSIHPLDGRVVVVSCDHEYVIKPPSMDCKERLRTLVIRASSAEIPKSASGNEDCSKMFRLEKQNLHSLQSLQSLSHEHTDIDVAQYVTRQHHTSRGHPIVVLDNIIPTAILDALADTMVNGIYSDDAAEPDSQDNVQWILGFDVEPVVTSPLWKFLQMIVRFASKKDGYYPYDISCNSIRSHDTTTIHTDCSKHEDEYTLLIYLNRNWTENDHGETTFFNYNRDELIFTVRPRYGRVAIFQGTIPHSARPPSPHFKGARFTFAIKFASSKAKALSKTIDMDIKPLHDYQDVASQAEAEVVQGLIETIEEGRKTPSEIQEIIQRYEEKLKTAKSR